MRNGSRGSAFSSVRGAVRWIHVNNKFSRAFDSSSLPVLRMGYEEFVMFPEKCLRMICEWIRAPFCVNIMSPKAYSASHILLGNPIKNNDTKFKSINYDASWMSGDIDIVSSACMFFPFIAKMNKRLVCSNDFV